MKQLFYGFWYKENDKLKQHYEEIGILCKCST